MLRAVQSLVADLDRKAWSWALYDWANSAFATTVMAGFFPVFFKQYWAVEMAATDSTYWLGVANSVASVLILLLAPLLGVIGDLVGRRKRFLLQFALLGVSATCGLHFASAGDWGLALLLYVMALLGFMGGNLFYDSLLPDVAAEGQLDRLSALGYGLGYLGGGLLFLGNVLMTIHPQWFGLESAQQAVSLSFLMVGAWWALFSIPVWLWVPEPRQNRQRQGHWLSQGLRQLRSTLARLRLLPQLATFLIAYWLYIDGVDTIVRMAVDYGLSLGFDSNGLIAALLITQLVGFPAAIWFGYYGERRGPKQGIMLGIFVYLLVLLWAYRMDQVWEFYLLAALIGLVQGGVQALSRSLYARLVPAGWSGEFYGFYNMLGKFAAVIGPLLMGWVGVLSGSPRLSLLSISVLFILGALLLSRVDLDEGERQGRALGRSA